MKNIAQKLKDRLKFNPVNLHGIDGTFNASREISGNSIRRGSAEKEKDSGYNRGG